MYLLPAVLDGYDVLAQDTTDLADGAARAYTVDGWPMPSYSPVIHRASQPPQREELDTIRSFLRTRWGAEAAMTRLLVPCRVQTTPEDLPGGWCQAEEQPLHVVVEETGPVPVEPDDGFAGGVRELGDENAEDTFKRLVAACFPDYIPDRVVEVLRKADALTELITVTGGTPPEAVSTVSLSIKGGTAFRNWGGVLEPYRGRRISRLYQRIAMQRAYEQGATTIVGVTRNPRLISPDRPRMDLWVYRNRHLTEQLPH